MTALSALANAIETAVREDVDNTAAARVCGACAEVLPSDGAAMTVMASDVGRETVYASDEVIAGFERMQYTLGEGPSLSAFTNGRPALVPDVTRPTVMMQWPGLMSELGDLPIASVFCFPMRFGAINVGVCALYRRTRGSMDANDLSLALGALDMTTLALLQLRDGAVTTSLLDRWLAADGGTRRQVHQATGMLIAQLGVSPEEAFARLRGYSFAAGRDIDQVADDIVNRRLHLEPDANSDLV